MCMIDAPVIGKVSVLDVPTRANLFALRVLVFAGTGMIDVAPRRGKLDHLVLMEYVEEYPLLLGLPGMNSKIEMYIRNPEGDRT